ncbi:MAG: S-methyl-5'-thioinosine phosphorylase [Firmicutes bacterium]|nr:S-methyl-5'-thioinosine phosphorylase [Bacillota bacterium]
MRFAIIGGTGVENLPEVERTEQVVTRYGAVTVDFLSHAGEEIAFLSRHGHGHELPPHRINFRANLLALQQLGVTFVYATATVGSMNPTMPPGSAVLVDDFIDLTHGRPSTYYERETDGVAHLEMSDPYCAQMRQRYLQTSGVPVFDGGALVCTQGPRFETASEVRAYRQWGGDLCGMTTVPEVILAKELGLCYATVAIVTNWCTGIADTALSMVSMDQLAKARRGEVVMGFLRTFERADFAERSCRCAQALMPIVPPTTV